MSVNIKPGRQFHADKNSIKVDKKMFEFTMQGDLSDEEFLVTMSFSKYEVCGRAMGFYSLSVSSGC